MKLKKTSQAVFINLKHPTYQRYVNPFELTPFVQEQLHKKQLRKLVNKNPELEKDDKLTKKNKKVEKES